MFSTPSSESGQQEAPEYLALREKAELEANTGRLQEALETWRSAVAWAHARGDAEYQDRAYCGEAALLIALGQGPRVAPQLRQILMRSSETVPQILAAYNLSRFHDQLGEHEKGLSLAQRALYHARCSGQPRPLIRCLNSLANSQCTVSDFRSARNNFLEALNLLDSQGPAQSSLEHQVRTIVMANLGSCFVFLGNTKKGLSYLSQARRNVEQGHVKNEQLARRVNLGNAFGYLQADRPLSAVRMAQEALQVGAEAIDPEIRKKAFFALGEANKMAGSQESARHWYQRLQKDFYADAPDLVELLLHTDSRELVNPWL